MPLRIVFMGTPDFAVPSLTALAGAGHEVAAVYTQPPRPAGRGMAQKKSPVHLQAEKLGLQVLTPSTLKGEEAAARFAGHGADAAFVVAYGLLLPPAILEGSRLGAFNLHASLLPRWRGAAPIQRAILAGDSETGIVVMKMEAGLDTGPMAMVERVRIGPDMSAGELHDQLARLGADLLARAAGALERGSLALTPQPREGVTYAAKIDKAEARIDWSLPAQAVHNRIRGLSPFPGAWFEIAAGGKAPERIKVLSSTIAEGTGRAGEVLDDNLAIACGSGAVRLLRLQRAGRRAADAAEFLRGVPLPPGTVLA
jgi:methionyl-tRNA formyltransferase